MKNLLFALLSLSLLFASCTKENLSPEVDAISTTIYNVNDGDIEKRINGPIPEFDPSSCGGFPEDFPFVISVTEEGLPYTFSYYESACYDGSMQTPVSYDWDVFYYSCYAPNGGSGNNSIKPTSNDKPGNESGNYKSGANYLINKNNICGNIALEVTYSTGEKASLSFGFSIVHGNFNSGQYQEINLPTGGQGGHASANFILP